MEVSCLFWVHVGVCLATVSQTLDLSTTTSAVLSMPGQIPEELEGRRTCPVWGTHLPSPKLQLASPGHPSFAFDLSFQLT